MNPSLFEIVTLEGMRTMIAPGMVVALQAGVARGKDDTGALVERRVVIVHTPAAQPFVFTPDDNDAEGMIGSLLRRWSGTGLVIP